MIRDHKNTIYRMLSFIINTFQELPINYIVTENKEDIDITILTIYDKSEDLTMKKNILVKMVKLSNS